MKKQCFALALNRLASLTVQVNGAVTLGILSNRGCVSRSYTVIVMGTCLHPQELATGPSDNRVRGARIIVFSPDSVVAKYRVSIDRQTVEQ